MPVRIQKLAGGKFRVSTPNMVHARATTRRKAEAQQRIIEAAHAEKAHRGRRRMKTLQEYAGR